MARRPASSGKRASDKSDSPRVHGELVVPPAAQRDGAAVEMLRAWIAEEGLHCALNTGYGAFSNPHAWGILLADVARHVSNAHAELDGADPANTLWNIVDAMRVELREPTSCVRGDFVP